MIILRILGFLLWLYLLVLVVRLVLDWVQYFAREWRPRGVLLVIAETAYTLTDPPLRALRKVIPPIRIGSVGFDVAFLLLFLAVGFGARLLG